MRARGLQPLANKCQFGVSAVNYSDSVIDAEESTKLNKARLIGRDSQTKIFSILKMIYTAMLCLKYNCPVLISFKTQIRQGIYSKLIACILAWRNPDFLATHWRHSEYSDPWAYAYTYVDLNEHVR